MQTFEWVILIMTLGALWIAKEALVNIKKELLFKAKNKDARIVAIALLCIPLVQVLFPDPQRPATVMIWVCDGLIALAGLLMLMAKTGIAEDVILVNSLSYRFEQIIEYQVSRNAAKGRTELFFRTKRNQRKLYFELKEYNKILKFMQGKKNSKKKTKPESMVISEIQQQ